MIEIEVDAEKLEEARRRLAKVPYATQRAILPAMREMLDNAAKQLAESLEADVPLPPRLIRQAIKIAGVRLEGDRVVGEINVRGKHVPLIHYDAQPGDITARKGIVSRDWPGFTYALRAGERRASSALIKGAGLPFIAQMPGGHVGVYFRTGKLAGGTRKTGLWGKGRSGIKDHAAIKQLHGPDVQYHVASPEVEGAIVERAEAEFPAILARHVERALAEFGGAE